MVAWMCWAVLVGAAGQEPAAPLALQVGEFFWAEGLLTEEIPVGLLRIAEQSSPLRQRCVAVLPGHYSWRQGEQQHQLQVDSAASGPNPQFAGFQSPVEPQGSAVSWWAWPCSLLALSLLLLALLRRRPRPSTPAAAADPRHQAILDLQQLRRRVEHGDVAVTAAADRLMEILRDFLQAAVDVPAPRLLTEELLQQVRRRGWSLDRAVGLRFCLWIDAARFSGRNLPLQDLEPAVDFVEVLVQRASSQPSTGGPRPC
jgi:hypothetical protein